MLPGRKPGEWYVRNFLLVLMLACLPAILIGAAIYVFGTASVERVMNTHYEEQFGQVAESINDVFSPIEISTTRGVLNPAFDNKLRDIGKNYNPFHIKDIYNLLFIMKDSSPYIYDAFLYLNDPGWVISDTEGVLEVDDGELKDAYRRLSDDPRQMYWMAKLPYYADAGGEHRIALVHKLPIASTDPAGFMIVLLDGDKIRSLVNRLTPDAKDGVSFLMTPEGDLLGMNGEASELPLTLRSLVESSKAAKAADTFVYRSGSKSYSVSYGTQNRIGAEWIFASAASMDELTEPVRRISRIILWIVLLGLLPAVLLSWFVSQRVYQPIRQLVSLLAKGEPAAGEDEVRNEVEFIVRKWNRLAGESERLHQQLKRHMPGMREGFLLQLAQGRLYAMSEAELRRRMEQLDWELQGKSFTVAAIRLLGFARLSERFREGDEPLVTYAAANIAKELAEQRFGQVEAINYQNLTVGLLVIHDSDIGESKMNKLLYNLSNELTFALNRLIKMNVMICLGATTPDVRELPAALETAVQTTQFGDLNEGNQIRSVGEYPFGKAGAEWVYPFAEENDLLQAVRYGSSEESANALQQFVQVINQHGGNEYHVRQALLQLLGNLQFMMLKLGANPSPSADGVNPFERLSRIREAEEMVRWFQSRVIEPFIQDIRQFTRDQSNQTRQTIAEVIETLEREYATDLSLESCADKHRINVFTLSKSFKQATGMTFVEYLTQLRLNKAKELLGGSTLKINEIAEQVGYQGTYFNRIFKKVEGITPSRYRELHQNKEEG